MAVKKITRKIISKAKPVEKAPAVEAAVLASDDVQITKPSEEGAREERKRFCLFCQKKIDPTYTDLVTLRRFLTDRAKILAKGRSGVCSRHQRAVAKNIKYARHLALLPFVPSV